MSRRKVKRLQCEYDLFEGFKKIVIKEIAGIGRKKANNPKSVSDRYEDAVMRLAQKLRNVEKDFEVAVEVEIQFNREEVRILQGLLQASIPKLFNRKEAYDKRGDRSKSAEVDNLLAGVYINIDLLGKLL
jgi:non-homologous end joining protein Ku